MFILGKMYINQNHPNVNCLVHFFQIFLGKMSHNVPAVYDVFASPIKETVGFQGLQKCGWSEPWEAQPT
jgi:hypothetical protein